MNEITARINRVFVQESGLALTQTTTPAIEPFFPAREWLRPPPALQRKYGQFTIGISPRPFDLTHDSLARPDEAEPEVWWEEGVNELSEEPPVWVARRIFGSVELQWHAERPRLDARWQDLERLVRLALDS